MVTFMDKNKILELKREGKSNRDVARETGFDRKTVAKYWNEHLELKEKLVNAKNPKEINEIQSAITAAPKYDVSSRTTRLITTKFLSDLKEILDAEDPGEGPKPAAEDVFTIWPNPCCFISL